jgi:hypothetical protein
MKKDKTVNRIGFLCRTNKLLKLDFCALFLVLLGIMKLYVSRKFVYDDLWKKYNEKEVNDMHFLHYVWSYFHQFYYRFYLYFRLPSFKLTVRANVRRSFSSLALCLIFAYWLFDEH